MEAPRHLVTVKLPVSVRNEQLQKANVELAKLYRQEADHAATLAEEIKALKLSKAEMDKANDSKADQFQTMKNDLQALEAENEIQKKEIEQQKKEIRSHRQYKVNKSVANRRKRATKLLPCVQDIMEYLQAEAEETED
ncbi:Uu.00g006160.m01.CDS01 [Anthostomella pinea]|uniref:Uu.00g006160.m01.CDS01 n=1 Tax=Anthostomella pinea TaxID=933095 RepID=A0AAI8VKA0_9PEZI|nr:Uu.00g006160.m01.CDS01 [Anthostomella pinea]